MKCRRWAAPIITLFLLLTCVVQLAPIPGLAISGPAWGEYLIRTYTDSSGRLVDEVIFPRKPPDVTVQSAQLPDIHIAGAINTLSNVPTFRWSYGCSATSAAMLAGYYELLGYSNLYIGPTNGGACPLTNAVWGSTIYPGVTCYECPLSASHLGIDGRIIKGSVDDYWIDYLNAGPDPYLGHWTEHTLDCLGDFMGTNQAKYSNKDGSTTFYFYNDGSPLYDYTLCEPSGRDGCHGLKLFFQSRGYTVTANYTQYINPNKPAGFTFVQFQQEIDAGRPVLIQVEGHTMLGIGYDTSASTIYVHDTWDYSTHTMTWGGTYSGLQQWGVTVLQLTAIPDIRIEGNAAEIVSGDITPGASDYTDFGSTTVTGGTIDSTFTIKNTGDASLTLSGSPKVNLSGTHAADFTVTLQPASPIAAGGQTTFIVRFDPSAVGLRTATVNIASNDSDENPYTFAIQGRGLIWDSHTDSARNDPPEDIFASPNTIVYMKGTGFAAGTYSVSYYDATTAGGGNKLFTESGLIVAGDGILVSQITLTGYPSSVAGMWHALVQPTGATSFPSTYNAVVAAPDTYGLIANDSFTVQQSSIPEFPTALAAMVVPALSAGIYLWMRRKIASVPA
jgi:hypothetical protein